MKTGQKLLLKQIRSTACRATKVDNQLKALGLGRVGKSVVVTLNPAVEGMVRTIRHLVTVEEAKG